MKRLLSLTFALLLAASLAVPAFADALWEPENAFYKKHFDQCSVLRRSFYANGADGYIDLHESPESAFVSGQLENGSVLFIYWQYLDEWAYLEGDVSGWAPLSDLQVIYDYLSFQEEYGSRFQPYDDSYNQMIADWEGDTLTLWPYPGAAEASHVWQGAGKAMERLAQSGFNHIFVDEEGLTWGFCNYLYGHRNVWVCLDAPGEGAFTVRQVDQPELIPAARPKMPAAHYLPYTLGAAIAVAATLIFAKRYLPRQQRRKL